MTKWFAYSTFVLWLLMKVTSFLKAPLPRSDLPLFLLSPAASTATFRKMKFLSGSIRMKTAALLLKRALIWGGICGVTWTSYIYFISNRDLSMPLRCYLALAPLYFMGMMASLTMELVWIPMGYHFPAHHRNPILAASVSEFWGRRWNTWVSDWVRQMIFFPLRNHPIFGIFLAFALSGLLHEILINVPLEAFHGVNDLGSMMLFFALQAAAIVVEKRIGRTHPNWQRGLVWLFVFLPAPLIFNEGVLRIFHLY